jgi:hypothetical protein
VRLGRRLRVLMSQMRLHKRELTRCHGADLS